MKWYRQSFDYVLYDMSYENLILYGATIPSYDSDNKNKNDEEEINLDNPEDWKKFKNQLKNMK